MPFVSNYGGVSNVRLTNQTIKGFTPLAMGCRPSGTQTAAALHLIHRQTFFIEEDLAQKRVGHFLLQ
jgi:hypothetical protein